MARLIVSSATGEGSSLLDVGNLHYPIQISLSNIVVTSPRVRIVYSSAPHFLQFGGQVILGNGSGTTTPQVFQTFPLQWSPEQNYNLPGTLQVDSVFWKIPPGLTLTITVEWTT